MSSHFDPWGTALTHPSINVRPDWTIQSAIAALEAKGGADAIVAAVLPAGDPFEGLVDALVRAVTSLYPAWLPEADGIDDASEASVATVRRLAIRRAARTALFGPVVEALAARSVGGRGDLAVFPLETLVRECFKLICRSYGTAGAQLVLDTEDDPANLPHVIGWLAALGTFDLTLVRRAAAAFPGRTSALPAPAEAEVPIRGLAYLSAVEGRPSPISDTEQRIEARLRACPWAAGRAWNKRFAAGPLDLPVYPDLTFDAVRLVVEFDGPDHFHRVKYEADRQRDRMLQRCGYAVFRFTNGEVALDIERVIGEIEAEIARRNLR